MWHGDDFGRRDDASHREKILATGAHHAYQESRILAASPLELVRMLYDAAAAAIAEARRHLAAGDIPQRARATARAYNVVAELAASLNHSQGGDISRDLGALYDYIQRRLLAAHCEQADAPLAEALGLLLIVGQGWQTLASAPPARTL